VIPLPFDEKLLTNSLLSKFDIDKSFRMQYEAEVVRGYKQYKAYAESVNRSESTSGEVDGYGYREYLPKRSNLFIPKTYQQVTMFIARMMKALFNSNPYVDFIPKPAKDSTPESMIENEERAKLPSALVNSQLDRNNIVQVGNEFLLSMAFAKAGILGVGWRYETRTVKKRRRGTMEKVRDNAGILMGEGSLGKKFKQLSWEEIAEVEEVVWDDNEIYNIDWFDCWPDARGRNYNPDTWRHCWVRDWMTREQIENHIENVMKAVGKDSGQFFDISDSDWENLIAKNDVLEEGRTRRLNEVAKSVETQDSATVTALQKELDKASILYEVLFYYTGDKYGLIISRDRLAFYADTLYWRHKKIPVIFQPYDPMPNEVQGQSFCDWLYHLQEELNTNRNQRVDNRAININTQWITDDEELPSRILSRPGNVNLIRQGSRFEPVPVLDMTASAVQEEQIIEKDIEDVGYSAIALGVDAGQQQTATESTIKNANASSKIDAKINLYSSTSLRRLFYLMDMNNQQFMTDQRLLQVADEEGIKKWKQIGPDDIGGEWDYVPASANVDPYANKELRRQQLMQAAELGSKVPQFGWDFRKIGDDILKTFDVRNPEKYKVPDDVLEQQNAAAAQEQQAQMEAQQQAEMQSQQMKNQAEMQKKLIDIIGKLLEKAVEYNPMLLNDLVGLMGGNQLMGGGIQNDGQGTGNIGYGNDAGMGIPPGIG
jgi:hypothetical protein